MIQFVVSTATSLRTSFDALSKMNQVEQMKYVEKYFKGCDGMRFGYYSDVAMCVFAPVAIGNGYSYVLYRSGSDEYKQNSDLDKKYGNSNGEITVEEYVDVSLRNSDAKRVIEFNSFEELKESCSGESSSGSSGSGKKILFIGDSHSVQIFGDILYELMVREKFEVDKYAQCGAAPQHFMSKEELKSISYSFDDDVSGWLTNCNSDFVVGGKETGGNQKTPMIDDLLENNYDMVVVALGANLQGVYSGGTIEEIVGEFVKIIDEEEVECYWIGPPVGPGYVNEMDYDEMEKSIKDGLEENCVYISSKEDSDFDFCGSTPFGCDADQHYSEHNGGEAVAKEWAEGVFEELVGS